MYQQHRERMLEKLKETRTAAIIPTSPTRTRNHDCEYRFRPSSDFWYLTGFAEPSSVLVLLPEGTTENPEIRSVLFLRDSDPLMETWNGRRLGIERAPDELNIDQSRDIKDLWSALPELLKGYGVVMYRAGEDEPRDRDMLNVLKNLRGKARGGVQAPLTIQDPSALLHELRLFKDSAELDLMRRGAEITHEAHVGSMAMAAPGVNECEIDAYIDYTFRRNGSMGQAYTTIAAGGENACILHYIENNMELKDGDLMLIDAGAEMECYASDVTRTFPVNGTFTEEQRAIYEIVLESEEAAIAIVKPGIPHNLVHKTALGVLVRGLLKLGLLEGTEESVLKDETYRRFYMHGTSHYLGLDVHDCGAYNKGKDSRPIEPGMVFTVEPGIYIAPDDETVDPRWRGIGVRIEDDILVTADGHENLTASIPKSIEDVEAACRNASLESAVN